MLFVIDKHVVLVILPLFCINFSSFVDDMILCQYSENTVFDSNDQRISLDLICNCKMNLICLLFFPLNN